MLFTLGLFIKLPISTPGNLHPCFVYGGYQQLEHGGVNLIVRVNKTNQPATGSVKPGVPRVRKATVLFMDHPHTRVKRRIGITNHRTAIRRTIVYQYYFKISVRLPQNAVNRFADVSLYLIYGHYDRHKRDIARTSPPSLHHHTLPLLLSGRNVIPTQVGVFENRGELSVDPPSTQITSSVPTIWPSMDARYSSGHGAALKTGMATLGGTTSSPILPH